MKSLNIAAAVVIPLTLSVLACGGPPPPASDATEPAQPTATTAPQAQPTQTPAAAPQPAAAPTAPLASADGERPGLRVEVQELKRTDGGTVTLKLAFINTSGRNIFNLGGFDAINLVDAVGKKKYFVAEDSAGTCLCSRPLTNFEADARANVWAKFPAPPEDVQKIAVVVPQFPPLEGVPIS